MSTVLRFTDAELRAEIERLLRQLPEGMKHCTIVFRECALGHGWLTATNWAPFECPTCAIQAERARAEKAEAALSIEREASAIALRAEQMQRITAEARADRYLAAMRELVECPSTVDEATIPTRGIDAAPHQVVLNVSVSLAKLRNIRALVEEARRG